MRARLDEEMGAPPPATIDVDALVARGRRQVRLRRLVAVGGGAGLSVVALGTAVAVVLNGSGTGTAPTGYAASASASGPVSTPSVSFSRKPTPSPPPVGAQEQRLTGVAKALVQQYAPGAVATKDTSGREPLRVRADSASDNPAGYATSADLTVGGGTGNFHIGISRPGTDYIMVKSCENLGTSPTRTCDRSTGPDGEIIVRITEGTDGWQAKAFLVYITRTDGTGVFLTADDGNEHGNRAKTRPEPVFTQDQLVAMGTDPRWTLSP